MDSKQYTNYKSKEIIDILVNFFTNNMYNKNIEGCKDTISLLNNINCEDNMSIANVEATISNTNNVSVLAKDLLTDPNHRFISDKDFDSFNSKVDRLELEASITDVENNIKSIINSKFDNLLNAKDIMNAISNLRQYMESSESVKELIDKLSSIVNTDYLKEHESSKFHINDEDRKNLDQLNKFINTGCADWNAKQEDANYIRNKPKALPADGGNADTVGGYCAGKLINKQPEYLIIGIEEQSTYDLNRVNLLLRKDMVKTLNSYLKENTSIAIREGIYNFNDENYKFLIPYGAFIYGVGFGTIIMDCTMKISDNCRLENMNIVDCNVILDSENIDISKVRFVNCNIAISCKKSIITNCRFYSCDIKFDDCWNSIIRDNIVNNSGKFVYLGNNNVIDGNVVMN